MLPRVACLSCLPSHTRRYRSERHYHNRQHHFYHRYQPSAALHSPYKHISSWRRRRQGGESVVVLRLTGGGPAEESGLILPNDLIHAIDRVPIAQLPLEEVSNLILGEPSSQV